MSTRRELVAEQMRLMEVIREKTSINIVTCGNCGSVMLHEPLDAESVVTCYDCLTDIGLEECSDLWYEGCEVPEVKVVIGVEDVLQVANDLGLAMLPFDVNRVVRMYPAEQQNDLTATWDLIVENCIYKILNENGK
jgi:hypothetical protein